MTEVPHSLAVILATYNRADVLRETLEYICQTDRDGININIYLVDNNSTDHTANVIKEFVGRLPIVHLFEPRQGKSRAINLALSSRGDEDIVLFTDDDVRPCKEWFREILTACDRWPDHDVFGGRILVEWPVDTVPSWAFLPEVLTFGFSQNDLGEKELIYPPENFPFGPNFWVRSSIFAHGRTFSGGVGPNPDDYKMGQEIVFLRTLAQDGYEIVYYPEACVHHRIEERLLSKRHMCRRAWARGRGKVYMAGIPHKAVLATNRAKWYLLRAESFFWAILRLGKAMVTPDPDARFSRIISAITQAGIQIESVRAVRDRTQKAEA